MEPIEIILLVGQVIKLATSIGIDVQKLVDMQKKAREEGRDLTAEEMDSLYHGAEDALQKAKDA